MKSVNAVTIKELYDLSHTEAKPLMGAVYLSVGGASTYWRIYR